MNARLDATNVAYQRAHALVRICKTGTTASAAMVWVTLPSRFELLKNPNIESKTQMIQVASMMGQDFK